MCCTPVGAFSSIAAASEVQTSPTAAAAIPRLLDLLGSDSSAVTSAAAGALQQLARYDSNRQEIAAAGGVSKLAAVLCKDPDGSSMSGTSDDQDQNHHHDQDHKDEDRDQDLDDDLVSENVSLALQNLAVDPTNCTAAVKTPGLIAALAQLLQEERSETIAAAAGCLANMSWDAAGCTAVADCDGVLQQLMQLLDHDDQSVVMNVTNLVAKLAWEPSLCADITEAGGHVVMFCKVIFTSWTEQVALPVFTSWTPWRVAARLAVHYVHNQGVHAAQKRLPCCLECCTWIVGLYTQVPTHGAASLSTYVIIAERMQAAY